MFRSNNDAGVPGQDSFGFQDNVNGRHKGRGRARGDDFGLPDRETLVDLAATYLDIQARLWPDLVGTPAVPVSMPATIQPMAEAFERRFRAQAVEVFRPSGGARPWSAIGIVYLRFSDEGSNPRSLAQQAINVLTRARREGVFVPWEYVLADAAVSGTLACRRLRGQPGHHPQGHDREACRDRSRSGGVDTPRCRDDRLRREERHRRREALQ